MALIFMKNSPSAAAGPRSTWLPWQVRGVIWVVLGISIFLGGCAKGTLNSFIREGADLSFIKKICVMPFDNNSKENFAPGRVRNIVITQVLVDQLFDVVEVGQLQKIVEEELGKTEANIDEATGRRIAKRLSSQAFLLGSVDEYDEERKSNYSYPKIGLTLRLVDAETGIILWQASGSNTGYSAVSRVFGNKGKDQSDVTFELVRTMLATLK